MIEQLLGEHPWMLLPLAAIFGVTYLIKALYALHGSFSQRRKEFLEIWSAERAKDNLWLEMAIRQTFGKYIPSDVIRRLLLQPDCARALFDVTASWRYLKYEQGAVRWAGAMMTSPTKRKYSIIFLNIVYFGTAGTAALLFISALLGASSVNVWVWIVGLLGLAFLSLDYSVDLSTASKTVPQRLGLD